VAIKRLVSSTDSGCPWVLVKKDRTLARPDRILNRGAVRFWRPREATPVRRLRLEEWLGTRDSAGAWPLDHSETLGYVQRGLARYTGRLGGAGIGPLSGAEDGLC